MGPKLIKQYNSAEIQLLTKYSKSALGRLVACIRPHTGFTNARIDICLVHTSIELGFVRTMNTSQLGYGGTQKSVIFVELGSRGVGN